MSIHAQSNVTNYVQGADSIFAPKLTGESFLEKKYKGDQFYNKDWVKADILLSTGVMVYNVNINYNGLVDQLIWLNPYSLGKFIIDKLSVSDFWFKNAAGATIHFKRIKTEQPTYDYSSDVFVQVAVEGKLSLYIQRRIHIFNSENYYQGSNLYSIDLVEPKPLYYIKLPSNHYCLMTNFHRRPFLKLFPDQKKVIDKAIKRNHLNFKNEENFTKIIELLNKEVFSSTTF
jgi:hypothetical protein